MREQELITLAASQFSGRRAGKEILKGIGDDCAVLRYNDKWDLLATCDTLSENTHFLKGTKPELLAHKLMAVNLSDIASMAGIPLWGILSLGAPKTASAAFLTRFMTALGKEAEHYKLSIVGGDTVRCDALTLTLTLIGKVERGKALLRSGAKAGDLVLVTGSLGNTFKSGKHLSFEPRLAEARWLSEKLTPNAMMDLSDGLCEDGRRLALASKLTMAIIGDAVPCAAGCGLKEALTGGEDFELLFTVPKNKFSRELQKRFEKKFSLKLTAVGEMKKADRHPLLIDGKANDWTGYAHF